MTEETDASAEDMIVIDLGKQSRKRVKKLRKGGGRLVSDVAGAIDDLKAEGMLKPDAQTVIVVVREKPEGARFPW